MTLATGVYLNKYTVAGKLLNSWKTLNMDMAYRIKLAKPELMFGVIRDEVILVGSDLISLAEVNP